MAGTSFGSRERLAVWLAGATRAACGGMLTTALAVIVGGLRSPLAVSLLAVIFFASNIVFAPLWGALADATGRRRELLVGTGMAATVVLAVLQFTTSAWGLIGVRGAYAVFTVGFTPILLAVVNDLAGQTNQGRTVGLVNSTLAAGDIGGQIAIGVLLGLLVPSYVFAVIAGLSLVGTAAAVLLRDARTGTDGGRTVRRPKNVFPTVAEWRILRRTGLDRLYAALTLRHTAVQGIGVLVPLYVVSRLEVSAPIMGLLLAVSPIAQLVFLPVAGRLADGGHRVRLVAGGMAASGVYPVVLALAALPPSPQVRIFVAGGGFVCLAAGFSAMDVGAVALIGTTVPETRRSAFLGLRATAMGVGGLVGSVLVGAVALATSIQVAFVVASLPAFGAMILAQSSLSEPAVGAEMSPVKAVEPVFGNTRLPGLWWR